MTVLMAGEEQPVFHDFLGIAGRRENSRQPEVVVLDTSKGPVTVEELEGEASTRASSLNSGRFDGTPAAAILPDPFSSTFQTSDDPGSEHLSWKRGIRAQHHGNKTLFGQPEVDTRQGKRRDPPSSRDSLQEQLQMDGEGLDNSRLLKASRVERQDTRKSRHQEIGVDDLNVVAMQPPRSLSKPLNPFPLSVAKADFPSVVLKKWDSLRPVPVNKGMFGPARTGYAGLESEKIAVNSSRECPVTPLIPLPPADEGSRTGLKGSGASNLINTGSGNPAIGLPSSNLLPGRSKLWSQNTGSESTFVVSQQTMTPTSRQLTIFYGGQAHVFDDVPPDKAEAIMTLAGSSGRSWSTMYSPRPKTSLPLATSESSLSLFDRDREKSASKASAMNGFSSLALSTEIHNVLNTSVHLGQGDSRAAHANLPEANFGQLTQWSTDKQIRADHVGVSSKSKDGREIPLPHVSAAATEGGKEPI